MYPQARPASSPEQQPPAAEAAALARRVDADLHRLARLLPVEALPLQALRWQLLGLTGLAAEAVQAVAQDRGR